MADLLLPTDEILVLQASANGDLPIVDGLSSLRYHVEALIVTSKGALLHRPTFGAGLVDATERPDTPSNRALLQATLRADIAKLPEVLSASVKVTSDYPYTRVSVTVKSRSNEEALVTVVQ